MGSVQYLKRFVKSLIFGGFKPFETTVRHVQASWEQTQQAQMTQTKRHNFMNPEGINALPRACDRNFNIKRQCCQNSLVTRSAGSILKIRDSTMQVSE